MPLAAAAAAAAWPQFWGCSDIHIGDSPSKVPRINSSVDQLSERLRSAQAAQDKLQQGRPPAPALPNKADYWRAELLAANERLDETYHHGPPAGFEGQQPGSGRRAGGGGAAGVGSDSQVVQTAPQETLVVGDVPADEGVSDPAGMAGQQLQGAGLGAEGPVQMP